jgi:hypothetical protein
MRFSKKVKTQQSIDLLVFFGAAKTFILFKRTELFTKICMPAVKWVPEKGRLKGNSEEPRRLIIF